MRPETLTEWLAELERRHPRAIELGLDRVGSVWQALGTPQPAPRVLTIGGTNGKGSTVAFAEAAARAQGWRVGCYTSPHVLRYNERIRIEGTEVSDAALVAAFERIESARGDTALTYFEVGTLAALLLLAEADLDLAVLEVGLGGRLDAVNLIDPDVAVVTTVALDHQDWLGDTRAAIAGEKAGIARAGRPLLIGEREVEPALLERVEAIGAEVYRLGIDFDHAFTETTEPEAGLASAPARHWRLRESAAVALPIRLPLPAPVQWDNAVTALTALALIAEVGANTVSRLPFDAVRAAAGLAQAQVPGRLQQVAAAPEVRIDVGHNPQAALALAQWLAGADPIRVTDAVFAALADKDVSAVVAPLLPHVRHWHLAGLDEATPRGLSVAALAERLRELIPVSRLRRHERVDAALLAARAEADTDGRVLVFGSFFTVAEALNALSALDG